MGNKHKTSSGWKRIKLGEYLSELSERNNTSGDNDRPVLSVTNRPGFSMSEEHFNKKVFSKGLSNYKIIYRGQFAYNPSRVNVGSIACLKEFDKGLLSPMYITFEVKKGLDGKYLDHWILTPRFKNLVKAGTQGSVRNSLNFSALAEFPFDLPPEDEQKQIVFILNGIDSVVAQTQTVIDQIQTLKKGLMQELFIHGVLSKHKKFKKTRAGIIPETWKTASVSDVASVRYGLGQPPETDDNGIPMVRATDIKEGRIITDRLVKVNKEAIPKGKDVYLHKDDLLLVRSGAYTGDIGYVDQSCDGCVAGYDLVIRPGQSIHSRYLFYYLLSPAVQNGYFRINKSRSAQPHLNATEIEKLIIPLPPIDEQKVIADFLDFLRSNIELNGTLMKQYQWVKYALMQAFLPTK